MKSVFIKKAVFIWFVTRLNCTWSLIVFRNLFAIFSKFLIRFSKIRKFSKNSSISSSFALIFIFSSLFLRIASISLNFSAIMGMLLGKFFLFKMTGYDKLSNSDSIFFNSCSISKDGLIGRKSNSSVSPN